MNEFFREIFSWVCGQNAAHTWAPAGQMLPLCQRCTGFYVGAALALAMLLFFRPRTGAGFCWLHALLVLAMTPFGFHLVAHGAFVRSVSGQWFAFGVVGLLWLLPARTATGSGKKRRAGLHILSASAGILLLPAAAVWGGLPAAVLLPYLSLAGLLILAGLVLANCWIIISWIISAPGEARSG